MTNTIIYVGIHKWFAGRNFGPGAVLFMYDDDVTYNCAKYQ